MKASVYTKYGLPEVVKITEIEKPVPKDSEVLIKVEATTVNRTDCGFRSSEYLISRFFTGWFKPKNNVLGCEFAGVIEATTAHLDFQVRKLSAGDFLVPVHEPSFTRTRKSAASKVPDKDVRNCFFSCLPLLVFSPTIYTQTEHICLLVRTRSKGV